MPFLQTFATIEDFEKIYDMYFDKIYRYIYFKVPSKEDAQDITAEVFCRLYRYLLKKKRVKHIQSFLYTMARNQVTDFYRAKVQQLVELDESIQISDMSQGNGLEEQTALSHDLEYVKKGIKLLPKQYQDIIILRYIEGYDIEQTAKILNKSEGAIRVTSHRALKALETCLKNTSLDN